MMLRTEEAVQSLLEAARLAEEIGDLPDLYKANQFLIGPYMNAGRYAEAREAGSRCVATAERLNDPDSIAVACSSRAMASMNLGQWDDAEADIERALSLARDAGALGSAAFALLQLGQLRVYRGELEEATAALEESASWIEQSGDLFALGWVQRVLAQCDIRMGHPERARWRLLSFMKLADEREAPYLVVGGELALIAAYVACGEVDRADAVLQVRQARRELASHPPAVAETLLLQARIALRRERWAEARRALEQGSAVADGMSYPWLHGRFRRTWAQLYVAEGRADLAREQLGAALDIFGRLGARLDIERAERALAALPSQESTSCPASRVERPET
jgi:tetratricopeptide (TPR) repeat protein